MVPDLDFPPSRIQVYTGPNVSKSQCREITSQKASMWEQGKKMSNCISPKAYPDSR